MRGSDMVSEYQCSAQTLSTAGRSNQCKEVFNLFGFSLSRLGSVCLNSSVGESWECWMGVVTRARRCVWELEVSRLWLPRPAHFHINKNDHKRLRDKPPSHRNTRGNDTLAKVKLWKSRIESTRIRHKKHAITQEIFVDWNPFKNRNISSLSYDSNTQPQDLRDVRETREWRGDGWREQRTQHQPCDGAVCRVQPGRLSSFLSGFMFQTSYDKFIPTILGLPHSWNTTITSSGVSPHAWAAVSLRYNIRLSELWGEDLTQVASHLNIFIYLIILMIIAMKEKSGFRDNRCHVESVDAIYFCRISPSVWWCFRADDNCHVWAHDCFHVTSWQLDICSVSINDLGHTMAWYKYRPIRARQATC